MKGAAEQALDQLAHAVSAVVVLGAATLAGAWLTPASCAVIAFSCGLIREVTEWMEGGAHPFTPRGLLDLAGWTVPGFIFGLVVTP